MSPAKRDPQPVGMTEAQREQVEKIRQMRDGIEKKQAIKALADECRVDVQSVEAEVNQNSDRPADSGQETPPDPAELYEKGRTILEDPDVLARVRDVLPRLGYAGEVPAAEIVHLAFHSRLLGRPLNLMMEGPSGAGKTYTVETVARLHPPEAFHNLTAMSERSLVYSDRDFRHTMVCVAEGSALHRDGVGATIVRSLAWGNGITYDTTVKTPEGLTGRTIEKEGPTGLITTTTKPLDEELATRVLSVPIPDSGELTREIVRAQAKSAAGVVGQDVNTDSWIAAARWLAVAGEHRVVIPFAPEIAEQVPADDVRIRRDFAQVLTMIEAHALIHQRSRGRDDQGRVVAGVEDYDAVRRLLADVMAATVDAVSETVRETVTEVEALSLDHPDGVRIAALTERLRISRQAVRKRVQSARRGGYLVNEEVRDGHPMRLKVGEPLPPRRVVLPNLNLENPVVAVVASRGSDNLKTSKSRERKGNTARATSDPPTESNGGADFIAPEPSAEKPEVSLPPVKPDPWTDDDRGEIHDQSETVTVPAAPPLSEDERAVVRWLRENPDSTPGNVRDECPVFGEIYSKAAAMLKDLHGRGFLDASGPVAAPRYRVREGMLV